MVRLNDPFRNAVEDMNDGSMKCKFCGHLFAKGTSISRIKWHLSGEKGHGVDICGQVPKEVQEAAFLAMHGGNKRHKSIPSSSNVNDYAIPTCPQEQDNAGDAGRMQVGVQGMENTGEGSFQHVDRSVSPSRLGVDAHENRGEAAQGTDVVNQLAGGTWDQIFSEAQKLNEINLMLEEEIESTDEEAVKMISLGGKFERVSYLPARRGIGDRSVKDYEAFESRRHVLDEILEALEDNDVNLVGVYGMPGVGKTTIVKKVAEQVKANRIFDVVVLAVVSKTPDLRQIQGEIADGLGFELKAETNSGRAERLRERLERETKLLVILDDIWERLELDDVGIPSGSDHRGCKILMTSRDGNALYRGMDTQKLFHLKVLLENEAWNLFENKAGDAIKNPDLQRVAVEVAKRCAGLPILLVTVASALKGGDVSEWKDALERLKRFDKEEIDSRVYSALDLSYTSLKGEEIKSVFLLCGQLRPHYIPIHDLLRYTVGLGLFKRISTLEEARHRLNKLVNDLIACCLLEGGADGIVKMHDVLHAFAASVASRDHHVFALSPGSVLREWPAKDMLEQCSAISLPVCKIPGLPEVLNCPKLESFILYNRDPSLKIPDCLFEGTKTLQLMHMGGVQLPTLPSSLQFLEKLQTLCLHFCRLGDIALIGELKMLKVLSLVGSNIVRLPREIGQLTRLQLLDLKNNPKLEIILPNVLSCLTQLEDLYMENSFLQWGVEGLDDRRNNASLAELKDLPYLSTLYLHITDPMILPKDFFSKKLERFNILIGEGWEWSSKRETSTIMKLKISASIQSEEGIHLLLKRTEDLHLDGLQGVKSVSYELDGQGFRSLKHLHIQNSLEIRYIVDSTMLSPIVAFPFLVSLSLDNLNKLEKICNGQPVAESFSKLRILKVKSCPMLKNLFSLHMQRGLLQLEEISIIDCEIMEVIVAEESGGGADEDEAIKLTQLRTLTLEYLPQFISVSSKSNAASISQTRPEPLITDVRSNEIASDTGLRTPMTLFNKKIEFPNLEDLKLSSIEVEKIWQDQPGELSYGFVRLTSLIVEGCRNLKYLFTTSMVESLAQLKRLELCDCVAMEEIIIKKGLGEEENVRGMMLPKLEFLKLKGLPNLTRFCTGHLIQCCFLQELWIQDCPALKTFISNSLSTDAVANNQFEETNSTLFDEKIEFPNLEDLKLSSIEVEKIWQDQPRELSYWFVRLTSLIVQGCRNLKYLFTTSMVESLAQLKRLELCDCEHMEEIIINNGLGEAENVRGMMLPKLEFLKLKGLPNLTRFCTGHLIQCCFLQELWIQDCPALKTFISNSLSTDAVANNQFEETNSTLFDEKIEFPNLEDLKLSSIEVEKIWQDQPRELSYWFVRLTSLIVQGCRNLKYLFTTSMVESLAQLKRLELCDCEHMEEIIINNGLGEAENVRGMMLPKLEFLKLKGLPNLTRFCTGHLIQCCCLQELWIQDCPALKTFISNSLSTDAVANNQFGETNSTLFDEKVAFSNIEILCIRGMDNLNMIWHTEFHSDSFCKLKVLRVGQGNKLLNIFPPNMLRRFQNLEHLEVDSCASLEEVFDLRSLMNEKESHVVTAFKLKYMYVRNLQKLKKVWNTNPHGILSFQNLHLVNAWKCPSLKSLFPASVALGLPQLEVLQLYRCGLEEIVAEEERLREAPKFVFPKTSSFTLWGLPKLKSFYPGRHTSEWPVLKKIDVNHCNEVPVFDLEQDQLGIQIQQPLFSIEKAIPNLEELLLDVKDAVKVCQGQFSADLFHKVRVLGLRCFDDASAEFPFGILNRFHNMEKLVMNEGCFKELFPCQLVDEEEHTLARIRWLELSNLPDLEKIWNQDLRVDQLLQNLETLEVLSCDSLINLAPPASSFGNLTALHVWGCKALKYLVTSSTARSLVQLSVMSITKCEMVTEIVASNGDEAGNEIIFRKLESLTLDCLASLTSFCSVNFTFRFPRLTEVIVTNCPKMKTFSLGILSTPRLQKVWLSEEKDKGDWKGDLNITIQQLHI